MTMTRIDTAKLRVSVRDEYARVATDPGRGFHFHTGRRLAQLLEYDPQWVRDLPDDAVDAMAGTGNPFALGELRPGERVVDAGSGSGTDSLVAGGMVAPDGGVIGVDMTAEMIDRATRAAASRGLADVVEFRRGLLEALPVDDGWADVVISNGVLNLVPDKEGALSEMHRVLRPGGRLQLADIVLERSVPDDSKSDISLWTGCIAGGMLRTELEDLVQGAGFEDVEVTPGGDVFAGAPQHSNAAAYGTRGVGISARKVL